MNKSFVAIAGIALILALLWLASPSEPEMLFGADSGALSPGTTADDATVGTAAWSNTSNSTASDNAYAITATLGCGSSVVSENSVKIVKGGAITGDEKSTAASLTTSDNYVSYGGVSDLWGTTWTADDINASTFGVVFSVKQTVPAGVVSHYLEATNFGFSIPAGATINGIVAEVEQKYTGSAPC